jgi:hypothetical protein
MVAKLGQRLTRSHTAAKSVASPGSDIKFGSPVRTAKG